MAPGSYRFDRFRLDLGDRRLFRDSAPVDLNARYLDALALLVREGGRLVSKDRFMDEVWRGVPVTDEALTQCIKTLRRQLGDEAGAPRFIETVPKHGYRFIAPVEEAAGQETVTPAVAGQPLGLGRRLLPLGLAGTMGGGVAGIVGGLLYGFAAASQPGSGAGAVSVLLVLLALTVALASLGAAGVSFGIAAARAWSGPRSAWAIVGGAGGGLIVGALFKLLGLDAFNLLFGRAPVDITGAGEGALLGGAVGLGAWLAGRADAPSLRRESALAAISGGTAGVAIALAGGRLLGGSLALLAREFPGSRLKLDQIGALLGEPGFGPASQVVTAGLEGALFGACIVGAITLIADARHRAPEAGGV